MPLLQQNNEALRSVTCFVTDHESLVAQLTRRLKAGDESAYREVYDAYGLSLLRYLCSLHDGDLASAKDSLQETFIRIAKYIRAFEREDVFISWMHRIARSAFIDSQRKSSRYLRLLNRFSREPLVADPTVEAEFRHTLKNAIARLEPASRKLIEASYFENLSHAQIAQQHDISIRAVEGRLSRARAKLRKLLERADPDA